MTRSKNKLQRSATWLGAVALAMSLAAGSAQAQKKFVLGAAYQGLSRPINVAGQDGARKGAKEAGVELRETDAQDKFDKQLNDVQDLISQGVDGLLIWPADSGAAIAFIRMAKNAGIPVVAVNTPFGTPDPANPLKPADGLAGFVTWSDLDAGRFSAMSVNEYYAGTKKPIQIAVLEGRSGYVSVRLRRELFDKTLTDLGLPFKIVGAQPGDWTQEKGEAVCQNFIAANPELDAIYSMSDEMSVGCSRAVKAAGSNVNIFSVAGSAKGLDLIRNGSMISTVCHQPADNGYLAVKAMIDILKGGKWKTDVATISPSPRITKANLADCTAQW